MARHFRRKRPSIIGRLARLVLMAVFAYVVVLGASVFGMYSSYQLAAPAFESLEDDIARNDFESARKDAEVAHAAITDINGALSGAQWDLACHIPLIGEEVKTAREAGAIADELVGDALLPVLEEADGLASNITSLDVVGTISSAPGALAALKSMRTTLDDCSARADALPHSRLPFINAVRDKIGEVASETLKKLDAMDSLIGMAGAVTNILT